jgi:hypothetical protein
MTDVPMDGGLGIDGNLGDGSIDFGTDFFALSNMGTVEPMDIPASTAPSTLTPPAVLARASLQDDIAELKRMLKSTALQVGLDSAFDTGRCMISSHLYSIS